MASLTTFFILLSVYCFLELLNIGNSGISILYAHIIGRRLHNQLLESIPPIFKVEVSKITARKVGKNNYYFFVNVYLKKEYHKHLSGSGLNWTCGYISVNSRGNIIKPTKVLTEAYIISGRLDKGIFIQINRQEKLDKLNI